MWSETANLLGLPAASEIVNCHSGCRQTSKTAIICPYYPPPLKQSPMHLRLCPPPTSIRRSIVRPYPPLLFHPCTRMFMNSLICFCRLPRAAALPLLGHVSCELMILRHTFPSHCSTLGRFSAGSVECLGSIQCITRLPV